jgi:glycerol-3-phosphate dehydrogenase (NAD(P)+)
MTESAPVAAKDAPGFSTEASEDAPKVAVLGAGSWGTALAALLAGGGRHTTLWALEDEVVSDIRERRENAIYLPDVTLPPELVATTSLQDALQDADFVISVSPSQHVRSVMTEAAPHLARGALVVSASKGIETSTLKRMDQVMEEVLPEHAIRGFSVLSGPSFAAEVARGTPTAVVVASRSPEAGRRVQALFQTDTFRVYTNPDVVGVELGGAVKNVVALAAGVVAGLGYGHNTLAALITRGLAEITRLGVAMGAERATFSGLAGIGDLVLTCTGELSRNRGVGFRLGQGEPLDTILGEMKAVAEGVRTAQAVFELARLHDVEMPITEEVHAILTEGRDPRDAMQNLMLREPKAEQWA